MPTTTRSDAVLQAPEAEINVLGALLIDSAAAASKVLAIIGENDFTTERHRLLFHAAAALHRGGSVADPALMMDYLAGRDELERAGGLAYISELLDAVPTAANVEHYARVIAERSARRNLLRDLQDGSIELPAAIRRAETRLHSIHQVQLGIGAPSTVGQLLAAPELEEKWIAEGMVPRDANILLAGYPKSHKTNFLLELIVSAAAASPFLQRFPVRHPLNCAAVFMEDRAHRVRRRLERICLSHGVALGDLESRLSFWFRPPLRLSDPRAMAELTEQAERLRLDLLIVDSWSYVSTGNSNDSDAVMPQLQALAGLRERIPELALVLVHHARKAGPGQDPNAERLTDTIRNSSSFAAWYDAGIVLARADENAPVKVRTELRDLPAPAPFAFTVEDQVPAGPDTGPYPAGWLRLAASDVPPAVLEQRAAGARFAEDVTRILRDNPGCSKRFLREKIKGDERAIAAAFDQLCEAGLAYYEPAPRGKPGRCFLNDRCGSGVDRCAHHLRSGVEGGVHTPVRGAPPTPPTSNGWSTTPPGHTTPALPFEDYEAEWEELREGEP
jgi:hypothetical protein